MQGGFAFVQAGSLNAAELFIFSVSYFNLEGLRTPHGNGTVVHTVF